MYINYTYPGLIIIAIAIMVNSYTILRLSASSSKNIYLEKRENCISSEKKIIKTCVTSKEDDAS